MLITLKLRDHGVLTFFIYIIFYDIFNNLVVTLQL